MGEEKRTFANTRCGSTDKLCRRTRVLIVTTILPTPYLSLPSLPFPFYALVLALGNSPIPIPIPITILFILPSTTCLLTLFYAPLNAVNTSWPPFCLPYSKS